MEASNPEPRFTLSALAHDADCAGCWPESGDTLRVRLRCAAGEAARAEVCYRSLYDHVGPYRSVGMAMALSDGVSDVFEASLTLPDYRFRYYFRLTNRAGEDLYYTSDGAMDRPPEEGSCFFYPCINPADVPRAPEWAKGAMVYQIWTDRFFNADPRNDPPGTVPWGAPAGRGVEYGGDFAGIVCQAGYLKGLGVQAVYLNPVFASPSYHKYDTADYTRVEDCYGGGEGLKALVAALHGAGIRVILDAVFNHCSNRHPFFRDLVEKGAASRYRGWFLPRGFPVDEEAVNYDTFAGLVREMPRWNTANDGVIDYLCGVAEFWTREADLDGWRLDVADELNHRLLRRLRERLEAVKPDVLLLGEIWNHAHRYVTACQLHAVTNYKFRTAALDFALQKTGARDFWNAGQANRMYYRTSTYPLLMNLLGSHDTARFATLLGDRSAAVALCALLLAMDGMPMLYYGDEVLMEGGADPDNRRAMRWDLTQTPEAAEIRALMAFRGQSECLRKGSLRLVKAEGGLLAFSRETPGSRLVAAVNFGPEAGLETPGRQLLGNARTRVGRAELPRNGYGIWEDESWSG